MTRLALFLALALALLTGCDSTDTASDDLAANDAQAVDAAALSLGHAVALETGGALGPAGDVRRLLHTLARQPTLTPGPLPAPADASGPCRDDATLAFDPATVTWTLAVDCTLEAPAPREATRAIARTLAFQFRDASGAPMPNYRAGGRTATTLALDVLSGQSTVSLPRLDATQTLDPGAWTIDGIDTPETFTLDGDGGRSGSRAFTGDRVTRTSTFALTTALDGLAFDRTDDFAVQAGVLQGRYTADVKVEGGGPRTGARSLTLDYVVTFAGGGTATLELKGSGTRADGSTFAIDRTVDLDWRDGSFPRGPRG
jgi:hypothetical protein